MDGLNKKLNAAKRELIKKMIEQNQLHRMKSIKTKLGNMKVILRNIKIEFALTCVHLDIPKTREDMKLKKRIV